MVHGGSQARGPIRAYARATAMPDLSHVCDLHHSSWQRRTLNPLSEARDRTRNLMALSCIRFCCATMGTPRLRFLITSAKFVLPHKVTWQQVPSTLLFCYPCSVLISNLSPHGNKMAARAPGITSSHSSIPTALSICRGRESFQKPPADLSF